MKKAVELFKRAVSFLFKDLSWKLISLVLAMLLWLIGMNVNDPNQNRNHSPVLKPYNIEILESQDIRVLNAEELESMRIRVNVRAPRSVQDILAKSPSEIEASIDYNDVIISEVLSSDTPVTQQLSVNVDIGLNGEYMSINPRTVEVELDRYIQRDFDVKIVEIGNADPEHELVEIKSLHKTVTASAAKSIVDKVTEVQARVDLNEAAESFSAQVDLAVFDVNGNDITEDVALSVTETTVETTILPQKEVRLSIGYTGSLMYNYVVTETLISPETVKIIGEPEVLAELDEITLTPLDLTNHNETYNISVDINESLPENIRLRAGQSELAAVAYTIEPLRTQEFLLPSEDIRIVGYSDLAVRLTNRNTVAITVQGPDSVMSEMSASNISAQLNVAGLGVGEHSVPLRVFLPADSMAIVGTPMVDVVISEAVSGRPDGTIWEVTFGDDGTPVFVNMETRELYDGVINPQTGLPESGVVIDPATGSLVSGIDPVTGLPVGNSGTEGGLAGDGTDPAAGSAAGGAIDPATGNAADGATDPATGNAADGASDPATGSTAGGATDPATGNAADGATDPASGNAAGGATDPASGNAAGGATDPAAGNAAGSVTDPADTGDEPAAGGLILDGDES